MTPIQCAIARVASMSNNPKLNACVERYRAQSERGLSSAAQIVNENAGVDVVPPPRRVRDPQPPREREARPLKTRDQLAIEENARMAAIEGDRGRELLREAERDAALLRCRREIEAIEQKPRDVNELAYLVTMGAEDWRREMRMIEQEPR